MVKIAVWGLGRDYNSILNLLKYYEFKNELCVVGLIDTNAYIDELDGYKVFKPDRIKLLSWDYILIASEMRFKEIVEMATMTFGIPREKIISHKVLSIPYLKFDSYIKLLESRISIISNNCWGGLIYSALGMECLSPLKNLFVLEHDYLRLISDFRGYMDEQFVFSHYSVDIHSQKKYPIFKLRDIEIHCNHAETIESAHLDWERRKKKINYSNLFYEMYTEKENVAQEFECLTRDKKSVCFVPWKSELQGTISLLMPEQHKEFYETVNANATTGTHGLKYCLVDLLQGKEVYRY